MMIKSLLTASLLSVIGTAVSTTAFADTLENASTFCKPGFYAGVQGGRSDTFYNASNTLYPAQKDSVGKNIKQGGFGVVPIVSSYAIPLSDQKVDDIGLGGRLYAGYQFNRYFALEAGYTQFAKTDFSATATQKSLTSFRGDSGRFQPHLDTDTFNHYDGEITEHAIDLVGKFTLPLQSGWGLHTKMGMAYITADSHTIKTVTGSTTFNYIYDKTTTSSVRTSSTIDTHCYNGFRPVAGAGISYTIPNTDMSITADYTRVFSYGSIPNAALASLGLEYKFA